MAPKDKYVEIKAMWRRLRDETSYDDQTTQLSGSLEIIDVQPNPKAAIPKTRVATRVAHTRALVASAPHSEEEDSNGSGRSQMTLFEEQSNSMGGSEDRSKVEFSIA